MNENINHWDTSTITDMSYLFSDADAFNQPLDTWNTSKVTNMSNMFYGTGTFDQPLNDWDISNVTNLSAMFYSAEAFNQPLDSWDTSSVTTLYSIFRATKSFNNTIGTWDTSNVTDMGRLFEDSQSFNQPVNDWNTSKVTSIINAFNSCPFNQPLDKWDVSKVTNMRYVFGFNNVFNQPLVAWDVSSVANMEYMFSGTDAFNQPIDAWNTSKVTNMKGMFWDTTTFNQPLNTWDTSKVTDMSGMFYYASAFNQPLGTWNTSQVTNMLYMFAYAKVFNQPLGDWDTSKVTDMSDMFSSSDLEPANYDLFLANLAGQALQPDVSLGASGIIYCDDTARAVLTSAPNNWTITDGGFCPPAISSPNNLAVVSPDGFTITGTAVPSRTVHITIDSTITETTASVSGAYSFTPSPVLTTGWHNLSVRSTDINGNAGASTSVSFYTHSGSSITLSGGVRTPTLSWSVDLPDTTYTVCWDTTPGGCSHSAETTSSSFTIPNALANGSWHFKVTAAVPAANGNITYTSNPYRIDSPPAVQTPLHAVPSRSPITNQASSTTLPATLTNASLGISSYQCSANQPSVALYDTSGLTAPDKEITLLGGIGFTLDCTSDGSEAGVSIALGTSYRNTAGLRAYKQSGVDLVDITDQVTFTTKQVDGKWQTTASYQLVDGGELDEDGLANGTIVDPIYIGITKELLAETGQNTLVILLAAGGLIATSIGLMVVVVRRNQSA